MNCPTKIVLLLVVFSSAFQSGFCRPLEMIYEETNNVQVPNSLHLPADVANTPTETIETDQENKETLDPKANPTELIETNQENKETLDPTANPTEIIETSQENKETLEAKVTIITNNPADLVNPDTIPDAASSSNENSLKGFVYFIVFIVLVIFGILALIWWGIGGICNACGCKETAQGCWSLGEAILRGCGSCCDLLNCSKSNV